MTKRLLLNCILAFVLALSLTACYRLPAPPDSDSSAPDTSQQQPVSQSLTLPVYSRHSLNPIFTDSQTNLTLAPLLYEGLFYLDTSFAAHNQLCSSYEVSSNGLTWTFALRRDAVFSDGTPLTASLAAQSLELARSAGSNYAGRLAGVTSVSAQSDHRLVITLSRPNSALPALLDIPIVLGSGDRPLGTGPYVLFQNEDDSLSLVPRDAGKATVPLVSVSRTQELTAAFEQGSISLVSTDLFGTDAPGFAGLYDVVDYDTTALIYLGFNTARSPFSSAEDRCAAAAALDRSVLVSTAWSGHARAAALPIHPACPLYDEGLARKLPSVKQAPELAEQAGLSGRNVTLIVNRENGAKVTAARVIARQLEQAGLTVSVSTLSWADYLSALTDGRFDLYLGEVTLTADFDLTPLISAGGRVNYSRWSSSRANGLLSQFLSSPDEDSRRQTAGQLCSYLSEQMPIAPLCFKRGSVLTCWTGAQELTPTRADVFFGTDL